MRYDRPGYVHRKNADGSIVRYWNPARVAKGRDIALPPTFRFPDEMTEEEVSAACRSLTRDLRGDVTYVNPTDRKRTNISEQLNRMYRKRAREIGKPFALTAVWIERRLKMSADRCEVSGVAFNYDPQPRQTNPYFKHPIRPSLDRIDNALGYTPDNIRVVLHCVNIAVNEWGLDNFVAVCHAVAAHDRGAHPDLSGPTGKIFE